MKFAFIFLFLSVMSCTSAPPEVVKDRQVAAVATPKKIPILDYKKSLVNIYPAVPTEEGLWYYFYVQLKDTDGMFLDCSSKEIVLKTSKGRILPFTQERSLKGRYYLTLEKTADISSGQIDVFVQGVPLKEQFKLHFKYPDKRNSKISILRNKDNKITFTLRLADKDNAPVEMPENPEIILEGSGTIDEIKYVSEGTWEFSLVYPEENQIMYFSVRAQGVYLSNLFRYQHVEK
jgi:hypothetical protein